MTRVYETNNTLFVEKSGKILYSAQMKPKLESRRRMYKKIFDKIKKMC